MVLVECNQISSMRNFSSLGVVCCLGNLHIVEF